MEPARKSAAAYLAELKSIKALMTRVEKRLAEFRTSGSNTVDSENTVGDKEWHQHAGSSHDKMTAPHKVTMCEKTTAAFQFVTKDLNSCLCDSRRARNGFRPRKPR